MKAQFKVNYYLWKARMIDKQAPLMIRSKQNTLKPIVYNTGLRLFNDQWNKKTKRPKNLSASLLELESKLQATYTDLVNQGFEPTLTDLLKNLNKIKKPTDKGVVAWCTDYLTAEYSEGKKKAVRTLKSNVEAFNKSLTFDKLTKPKLKAFFAHLTKQRVANNSQAKRLYSLRNVANHANIEAHDLFKFKLDYSTDNAPKVRLTWSEVKAVMDTSTESKLEAIAKDVFLLACFSGLRISDMLTLQEGELFDFHYERIQTKTKNPVLVTVHRYNEALFDKYFEKGVQYSRQRLSDALKIVLERSGLTKKVKKVQAVGEGIKEDMVPKFKEISFHSGRRFYARLLNDLGCGGEIARDELGHGFKSMTDLYAGSPEHALRIQRVNSAIDGLEKTMKQLDGIMKKSTRKTRRESA